MALAIGSAAGSAHAALVPFADFTVQPSPKNVAWENTGGVNGDFYTGTLGAPASVPVEFSFNNAPFDTVQNVLATLTITASASRPAESVGTVKAQEGLHGSFSITYAGLTDLIVNGTNYGHSSTLNLLSGAFTKGVIESAGVSANTLTGSVISFSSDISGVLTGVEKDIDLNLDAISPVLGFVKGHSLNSFVARSQGQFAQGVPEPSTWAMMLLGVGALGVLSRRRRALATA